MLSRKLIPDGVVVESLALPRPNEPMLFMRDSRHGNSSTVNLNKYIIISHYGTIRFLFCFFNDFFHSATILEGLLLFFVFW